MTSTAHATLLHSSVAGGARVDLAETLAPGFIWPRPGRQLVARPRLHRLLDEGSTGRLTLLSAPPGSGKTVLLRSWLEELGDVCPVAWLSLTERHDNAGAFWRDVAIAVAAATGAAAPGAEANEGALAATIFAALGTGKPLLLILDDFHEIRSPAVLRPLARLLDQAPELLRMVIASRLDPQLDLHRLRLYGDLTEIRARDLAFTRDETAALFASAGIELDDAQLDVLVLRTEGWAAALRFAAFSIREQADVEPLVLALDRTEHAVADYLVREVLARQPDPRRDFLLRTAACDRICGSLADALTSRRDGQRTLNELVRDNMFVELEPTAGGGWFRYHPLFAALLRAEAEFELGEELRAIHAAAARWFADNGFALQALQQAVAAGDAGLAEDLVGLLWVEIVGVGDSEVAARLLDEMRPEVVQSRSQLGLLAAWRQLVAGDLDEASSWMAIAEQAAEKLDGEARRRYDFGRSAVALVRARLEGDLDKLERAAQRMSRPEPLVLSSRDNERRRAIVLCARGAVATWRGELDVATATLEEALETSRRLKQQDCEFDAAALLALANAVKGNLKRAARLASFAAAFPSRNRRRWGDSAHLVPALVALALCSFEWNDIESAERYLAGAEAAAATSGDRIGRLAVATVSAWGFARRPKDAIDDVRIQLAGAATAGPPLEPPPLLASPLRILSSRIELAEGNVDGAEAALGLEESTHVGELMVAQARIELARDDVARASQLLDPVTEGRASVTYYRARVEATVLQAVVAARRGDADAARVWMERALELAEPDGMRGAFTDAAPAVAELLRDAIRHGTAHRWLAATLLGGLDGREGEGTSLPRELLDPLSEREQVVLRYLPTMMSNLEIAGELLVSVNTVKTHLKSIYRKLGVSHRRDAVHRARELRLIS